MKKFLLPLLLAASAVQAAPLDRIACVSGPASWNKAGYDKAQRALTDAQAHPEQPLVLANAYADLATAITTATGNPTLRAPKVGSGAELIQHAREIWSEAAPDPELAGQLQELGRRSAHAGQCVLAKPVLQVSLEMTEKTKGRGHPQTVEAINDLLRVSLALDDSAAVNALAPRLLEALDKEQRPGINLLPLYEDLGDFYYRSQESAQGQAMVKRAMELAKVQAPRDSALQRRLAYKLASIYYGQLRYDEAEELVGSLQASSAQRFPEPQPRRTREQMAKMVRAGDMAGALALGERALEQYESELARSQAALAEAQATYDSAPKSGPLRENAGKELRKAYGRANGDVVVAARMQHCLGEIHHAMNQLALAETLYLQAQTRFAKLNSNTFALDASRIASDLAILYRTRGEPERALPLQDQALKTMLPLLGIDHPDVLEAQDELAQIYRSMKRYAEAEPLYAAHLQRAERRGAAPQELAEQLDALSEIAVAQGDSIKGAFYAQRTVALWEHAGPTQNVQWRAALARLVKLYRESGQEDLASALEKRLAPPAAAPGKKKKP